GVAHGALHGGNILLAPGDGDPHVGIVDFGIREVHPAPGEQIPGLHRAPEHAFYLAPEQAKGLPGDHRSDIYALSAILYEMVTGRPPLVGETFAATVEKQISETPQAPSQLISISPELEATILRGLDKDPSRRIPSVEALLAAIDPGATTTGKHLALHRTPSAEVQALHLPAQDGNAQNEDAQDRKKASRRTPTKDAGKSLSHPGGLPAQILDTPPHKKTRIYLIAAAILLLLASGVAAAFFLTGNSPEKKRARSPKKSRPSTTHGQRPLPRHPAPRTKPHPAARPQAAPNAKLKSPAPKATARRVTPATKRPAPIKPARVIAKGVAHLSLGKARTIQRMSGSGTINIITRDPGAKIFLDGHYVGTGKTRALRRVPAGRHRLHIEIGDKKLPPKDITLRAKGSVDVQL
ncbi:MAG: protein kinase, partial [Deltaproteobacteria bacterium]|nr:protein kinase [Deltaproteobacteria bacterium]